MSRSELLARGVTNFRYWHFGDITRRGLMSGCGAQKPGVKTTGRASYSLIPARSLPQLPTEAAFSFLFVSAAQGLTPQHYGVTVGVFDHKTQRWPGQVNVLSSGG
jgi:hypothetical protein